jgi:hypothetical protein
VKETFIAICQQLKLLVAFQHTNYITLFNSAKRKGDLKSSSGMERVTKSM